MLPLVIATSELASSLTRIRAARCSLAELECHVVSGVLGNLSTPSSRGPNASVGFTNNKCLVCFDFLAIVINNEARQFKDPWSTDQSDRKSCERELCRPCCKLAVGCLPHAALGRRNAKHFSRAVSSSIPQHPITTRCGSVYIPLVEQSNYSANFGLMLHNMGSTEVPFRVCQSPGCHDGAWSNNGQWQTKGP